MRIVDEVLRETQSHLFVRQAFVGRGRKVLESAFLRDLRAFYFAKNPSLEGLVRAALRGKVGLLRPIGARRHAQFLPVGGFFVLIHFVSFSHNFQRW